MPWGLWRTRGVFDIFVPGTFLLLNLILFLFLHPRMQVPTFVHSEEMTPALLAVLGAAGFCIGYLLGVVLRVLRVEPADHLSGWFLRRTMRLSRVKPPTGMLAGVRFFTETAAADLWDLLCYATRQTDREGITAKYQLWSYERFPYGCWIAKVARERLGLDEFFLTSLWRLPRPGATELTSRWRGHDLFNFLKVRLAILNEQAAQEVWRTESLVRYISSMIYALSISWLLVLCRMIMVAVKAWPANPSVDSAVIWCVFWTYLIAASALLRHLRFMRLKEVTALLAATYHCRKELRT